MKRALITGGTGFVGANLARRLLRDGHEVHLLVRPDYHSWRIDSIKPDLRLHTASITDADSVTRAVRAARPNWVFHLAAYGAYPTQQDQQRMHDTNVLGTTTLLDACGHVTVEAFIHAGSSSEYGRRTKPHRETDDPHPESDYAKTKLAATRACQERAQQTGATITTLRLYSIYGPYEEPSRLIPRLIFEGRLGHWPPLASPETARDFVHVDDAVDAFLLAAQATIDKPGAFVPESIAPGATVPRTNLPGSSSPGAIFNVGTGTQTTLADAVATTRDLFGIQPEPQWASMPDRSWDTAAWVADNRLIRDALGWHPRLSFPEGLRRTADWYTAHPELHDVYEAAAG